MVCGSRNELIELVKNLEEEAEVSKRVEARIKEFEENGKRPDSEIFKELCFCILTANFNAERGMKIQEQVGNGFLTLPERELAKKLDELGHRHPNVRAKYIVEARQYMSRLRNKGREWLVETVKGLGYKESSHFLRNIGHKDVAIIDFHIIDILAKYGLVKKTETINKKSYLEIESILKEIAEKTGLNLAELDLYLWYAETGKILK